MVDIAASAYFVTAGVLAALKLGDPARIARALAWKAAHVSALGPKRRDHALGLLETCRELAERSGDGKALTVYQLAAGLALLQLGDWRKSVDTIRAAERRLREHGHDIAWELAAAETCLLFSWTNLGEFSELAAAAPAMLQRAMERGDLFAATNIAAEVIPQIRLAMDDPHGAHDSADTALQRWSRQGYHLQHLYWMISKANAWMYEGEAQKAVDHIDRHWRAAAGSLLFLAHLPRTFSYHVRARAHMLAAEYTPKRDKLIARALADAGRLEKESAAWTSACASLLRAGAAHLNGKRDDAISLLRVAERDFVRADMGAYLASARLCLASLLPASEAGRCYASAQKWMEKQGVRNPERFARVHSPGFGY
jgi:hypothetical protein